MADSTLAAAERTFWLLARPPHEPTLAGRNLLELRAFLLAEQTPLEVRDEFWRHLVDRHRRFRGEWTVAAVGMAMPALARHARQLSTGCRDVEDLHAEMVEGFLRELDRIDYGRPRIAARLLWAARRAGVRLRTTEQPQPVGDQVEDLPSTAAADPSAQVSQLLAEARDAKLLSAEDVELIAATRLGRDTMAQFARRHGMRLEAVRARRSRAERRLAVALRDGTLR